MQTMSGRFSTRGERGAGDPERPCPCKRPLLPAEAKRHRLGERWPSRDCDRDRSFPPGVHCLPLLLLSDFPVSLLLHRPLLPLLDGEPLEDERPDFVPL